MSDWPGDTAPLPHAAPEDRLGARLVGMVAREPARADVAPLRRCRACGNRGSNRAAAIELLGTWTA